MKITPPLLQGETNIKKQRSSNLELYRIICMLMIVAHHYVVCSGLAIEGGPLKEKPESLNSLFLILFGMWGKTGINCFLMITGYFMCKSKITLSKYMKLLLQVLFYNISIYFIMLLAGYESFSLLKISKLFFPIDGLNHNFVSCFLVFYLTIPFLTILVQNMNERQHRLLLLLLFGSYTVLGSLPYFEVTFNYVTWFAIIYFMASYIRLYPIALFSNKKIWGWITLACVLLAMISVLVMHKLFGTTYFPVSDSNKIFAVVIAISSFLWFKNINIPQSTIINAIGASTFGVLLIHSNSGTMRKWLWGELLDVVGHFQLPIIHLILFSVAVVLIVFFTCSLIDQVRIYFLEKPFFKWYDIHLENKLN